MTTAAVAPLTEALTSFLAALFTGCTGEIALRVRRGIALPESLHLGAGAFSRGLLPDVVLRLLEDNRAQVFIGPATRTGVAGDLVELPALFVDVNYTPTITAHGWAITDDNARDVAERITGFPLPPSAIVASGWGLHAWWLLDQPLQLNGVGRDRGTRVLRRLAERIGGETAELTIGPAPAFTIAACDPARLLRLPGSVNTNRGTLPRAVAFEVIDLDRRYSITDLEAAAANEPAPRRRR